ncbi:hypothetical protein B3286c1_1941 [Brucella vulpis]|nr:hypothetical protein BF3285c1_1942 [Brucella vulpis]CUW50740.1 hypothetical protein B3286c1_1941 [Brucella vulpis]
MCAIDRDFVKSLSVPVICKTAIQATKQKSGHSGPPIVARLQIDEKPLDFWQQSKTRGFDSDLFTF